MQLQDFEHKKIIIWGFGKEGQAALHFLQSKYHNQKITILTNESIPQNIKDQVCNISSLDFKLEDPNDINDILQNADLVIKSPGISLYRPEVQAAKQKGVIFTSALNIWFSELTGGKVIAITGTKGKSTTASLIAHLLTSIGEKVALAGNIGTPPIEFLTKQQSYDFYILELSSYQTADLEYSPDIGMILNLYPEHIDWHFNHQRYYLDKLNLFAHRRNSNLAVFNYQDINTQELVSNWNNIMYFNHPETMHVIDNAVYDNSTKLCDATDISLKGKHNLINVCAALTIIQKLGFDPVKVIPHLKTFQSLPHRLQIIAVKNGVTYVSDSIATIPEATIAAIEAYSHQDITLIVGGFDRQQNYHQLCDYLAQSGHVKNVITTSKTGIRIAEQLKEILGKPNNPALFETKNLAEAVNVAKRVTKENGLVLLSPAAPSYGDYKNFQERGEHFRGLVEGN